MGGKTRDKVNVGKKKVFCLQSFMCREGRGAQVRAVEQSLRNSQFGFGKTCVMWVQCGKSGGVSSKDVCVYIYIYRHCSSDKTP